MTSILPRFLAGLALALVVAACGGDGSNEPPRSPGWGTAELIETDNVGDAGSYEIASDASGNAIAVWAQKDGPDTYSGGSFTSRIWANRFSAASGTWGVAQLIETNNTGSPNPFDLTRPQVAGDPSGNAIVVWAQSDGTRYNIWATRFNAASGTWGTPQLLETDPGTAHTPEIAMDASGNAIAVWHQFNFLTSNVRARRFGAASGTWGTAQLIDNNSGFAHRPQVAFDASGNAIVVWDESNGADPQNIWARRFSAASGTWGTAQMIGTNNTISSFWPRIAVDASGNAIAIWWNDIDDTRFEFWTNRFSAATGTWGTAQSFLPRTLFPQIALDASGNAIAVWDQYDGTRTNIWAKRFTAASGTWGMPELIETDDRGDASSPQIAFDASGNAIAVWDQFQFDGTTFGTFIWANRFSAASGTWGTPQLIEDNIGHAFWPRIAVAPSGSAVVLWREQDVTSNLLVNIWANRFRPN